MSAATIISRMQVAATLPGASAGIEAVANLVCTRIDGIMWGRFAWVIWQARNMCGGDDVR